MIDQIISGAEQAFLAVGYDLATMDLVARHASVARASVYNHFKSKEELFLEVMRRGVASFVQRALEGDDPALAGGDRIRIVAINFLRTALEHDSIEMYRAVIAHSVRFPELSKSLYEQGLMQIEAKFCLLATAENGIFFDDPAIFAERLLSQLMGGYFNRRLLGIVTEMSPSAYVDQALSALRNPSAK